MAGGDDRTEYTGRYDDDDDYEAPERPQFVSSTPGAEDTHTTDPTGGFMNAFHFNPIHPMPQD